MTKEIVRTKTSKNAETLVAVYIYIYISILLQTSGIRLLDHIFYRNVQFAMQKLQCSNTFIQVAILLKKRENKKAKSVFEKICFINSIKEKRMDYVAKLKTAM